MLLILLKYLIMFGSLFIFVDDGLDWKGYSLYTYQAVHVLTRRALTPVMVRGTGGGVCCQGAFLFQCLLAIELCFPHGSKDYLGRYQGVVGTCRKAYLLITRFSQVFQRGKLQSWQGTVLLSLNCLVNHPLLTPFLSSCCLEASLLGGFPWFFFWKISLLEKTLSLSYIGLIPSVLWDFAVHLTSKFLIALSSWWHLS